MKKDILIVFPFFDIGGSTTSMINFLNAIDTEKYNVDLICQYDQNPYLKYVNNKITFLGNTKKTTGINNILLKIGLLCDFRFVKLSLEESKRNKKLSISSSYLQWKVPKLYSKISKKYDVAIGFMEGWANAYVLTNTIAKKKIAWFHTNYKDANLSANIDRLFLKSFDAIISVSQACKESFDLIFPEFQMKSFVIENIVDRKFILKKSNEKNVQFNKDVLNIVTVCRIVMYTKGMDRILNCAKELKDKGIHFVWHIIGDGNDEDIFKDNIRRCGLEDNFVLYGKLMNPFPYLKRGDVFVLPSRYEGKPISVTEAMILNVPVIVSNYAEAYNQVKDKKTGFVLNDIENELTNLLVELNKNRERLIFIKKNQKKEIFSNVKELEKLYRLIEQ